MTDNEQQTRRIMQIRKELCNDSNTEFARRIGKSHQHASALCNGKVQAGKQTLELLLMAFPNVSREWLYFGTGTMLRTVPDYHGSVTDICNDIADTYSHLAQLFNRLSLCVK